MVNCGNISVKLNFNGFIFTLYHLCYLVPNDLESTKGHLNVIIDGNIVSEADCHLTISKFPHSLRIETGRIDNIYAIAFESSLWNLSTIKGMRKTFRYR